MKIELTFDGFKYNPQNKHIEFNITTPDVVFRLIHNDDDCVNNEFTFSVNFVNHFEICDYDYGTTFCFRILGFGIYFWRGKL